MSNNHLIIGLGGTGGRIILAFRKTIYQEHRDKTLQPRKRDDQANTWSPAVARIGYLYVDSNSRDLEGNDAEWKVLGQSVKLDPESQLSIRDANVEKVFESSIGTPGIAPWLGDHDVIKPMIAGSSGAQGANQIRRFGRFLFATKITAFKRQVSIAVQDLIKGSTAEVSFHVCCTLAAGTGSGSLIDAICQIRAAYPDCHQYKIFVYALITDKDVGDANKGNFYANQYAALAELNALRIERFKPFDVSAVRPTRLELRDHFQQCFLLTGENREGDTAELAEQEQMIADYLYQKIVALKGIIPDALNKAESFEDLATYAHENGERSYSFGSLGLKRFTIPELEIREKLAFTFAEQAALQFQFNNWTDNGFAKAATTRDLPEFVTKPANNERWFLTDDHLKLSTDFRLTGGEVWSKLREDWGTNFANEKLDIMETNERSKEKWLPLLREFGSQHFDRHYRDRGVVNYYEDKRRAKNDYAREVRSKLEADLFNRWKTGEDSVHDTLRILDTLLDYLNSRKKEFDGEIAGERLNEEKASEIVAANEKQWNKIGWFTEMLTNRPNKIFGAFADALRDMYIARSEGVALGFAKDLVQQIIVELTELKTHASRVSAVITEGCKKFHDSIEGRCAREEHIDFSKKLVRFVEPQVIDRTIDRLTTDRRVQEGQAQAARERLCKQLGIDQTFSAFSKSIPVMQFMDILTAACDEAASMAHENLFKQPSDFRRIVGVNIIEKLNYDGLTNDLKENMRTLVQSAAAYMTFDAQQTQPAVQLGKDNAPEMPFGSILVFLPKCEPSDSGFRAQLCEVFRSSSRPGQRVHVVDTGHNPNEITIISVSYWFALRFMKPLTNLRKRYEQATRAKEDEAVHQLHIEGHRCEIEDLAVGRNYALLPNLFLPDDAVLRKKALPVLILAETMDVIRLTIDPDTGIESLYFAERNAAGRAVTKPIDLGARNLADLIDKLQPEHLAVINSKVTERLQSDGYRHIDKKTELKAQLDSRLDQVYLDRGQNDLDKVYQRFLVATEKAKELIA